MKPTKTLLLALLFCIHQTYAQSDCSSAIIVCGNTTTFNPSGVGTKLEQLACGGIEHNSVWIAFQAKANGKLNFVIRPSTLAGLPTISDVDWSLYQLPGAPGVANCNNKIQLSCNFAGSSTVFGIPGATGLATPPYTATQFNPGIDVTTGTWYMLHIDQFSNTIPLLLTVQFTDNPEHPALNSTPGIFDNRPDFTINTLSGCSGNYSFTNNSVAAPGIASYDWNFGDGSTSTAANPTHTYATPGTYYVTLTVTNTNGCQTSIRKVVIYNNTAPTITNASILALPACSNANSGSITVAVSGANTLGVSGGTPPYTYELVSPSPMIRPQQSSPSFTGLQPGGYFLKVTDACGKSAISTVITIAQVATNSLIGLGIQNIQSACPGSPTGTATIFANGTTPPYTMALINSSPVTTSAITAVPRDPVTATYYVTFTGLLPGFYTVEATDGCNKIRRATFSVAPSTSPSATTVSSPSCPDFPTGTLTVSATAGTGLSANGSPGTFQYALIAPSPVIRAFQNSSVFENLYPGTYTIAVRDVCGNVGTATSTIGTATVPNFGTSYTTPSCPNGSTGTIEVQNGSVAGGGSPYTYELIAPSPVTRPAQNNNAFNNLPPGTYTVRMTDVCGTPAITTVTVPAATAPTFTTTSVASCSSPASGTLTVSPGASAIGPFTFELISPGAAIRPPQGSNIANTNNSIFTALNQGSYTIRMTDGCGVPVTSTATIAAPTALTFPTGSVSVSGCASPASGQITVAQPTTGSGAYRYELIAPSPVTRPPQYSRIFNNLPTGNYTIRITDSCGTQVNNSATPLALNPASTPSLSVTNTASCATNTGTITCLPTTANAGGGTYLFALIAPSPVTRPNQASPIFTGLPAGSYTVQITDQCGNTGTTTTTVAAAGAFTPAAGASIASCDGSGYFAQIIVTTPQNFTSGGPIPPGSGGGPYSFSVYDATNTVLIAGPQASNVFPNITPVAGSPSHTIRVTDICGNTSITTVTINNPATLLAATITAITASCAASNTGVIRVTSTSTGGLAPLTYTLIDAVTFAVVAGPQTALTFTNVPDNATGYLVRTTDACGNTVTSGTALLFPAAVAPTATVVTSASCATPATGVITVTPGTGSTLAGGTFTYALYDAANVVLIRATQASPVFSNLPPATYTVRITDRCGTIGTVSATIASGGVGIPTATGTVTGTCTGGSSGVIRGSSTGGTLPVTYTLVNQVTSAVIAGPQADSVFSGLPAGTYIVRVTDACGTVTNSVNLVLGDLVTTPTITTSSALDCAGSANIAGYGGSGNGGPYTYAICSGAGCSGFGAFGGSNTFSITTSGTYRIAVRDRCGNQTSSGDIIINIPSKPVVTGITKANACGITTFTATFTGVPNTPYYSVDGSNFSTTIPSVGPGCHTLLVADNNAGNFGCASDPFNVSVFAPPALNSATPVNWSVTCSVPSVTPSLTAATGNTGCSGSGASFGVKLISCTGCNGSADPVGTVKAPGVAFFVPGATAATFAPVVVVGGTDICSGSTVAANFIGPPFNCLTLPSTLLSFAGQREGSVNQLRWTTSTEQNNRGFMVQRAPDGISYTDLGFVNSMAAGGNSSDAIHYNFTDNNPGGSKQYYRLRQEDLDGRTKFSTVVLIKGNKPEQLAITGIYPNPASTEVNVLLDAPLRDQLTLLVINTAGKTVMQKLVNAEAGSNTIPLNISTLPGGSYLVKLVCRSNCETTVSKFVKQD